MVMGVDCLLLGGMFGFQAGSRKSPRSAISRLGLKSQGLQNQLPGPSCSPGTVLNLSINRISDSTCLTRTSWQCREDQIELIYTEGSVGSDVPHTHTHTHRDRHTHTHNLLWLQKMVSPGRVTQLVRVSSRYAKVLSLISGQGTYKKKQ